MLYGHPLVVQRVVGVQGVRLQHVEVLDLGVGRLLHVGRARWSLSVVERRIGTGIGTGRRRVDGRVMRVARRGWVGVAHDMMCAGLQAAR